MKKTLDQLWRPKIHFSPISNWMNDPCGLIYWENEYHLYFQHHPFSSQWGSMHWGHAISKDLFHWQEKQPALEPDPENGMMFTGSTVWDKNNSSGRFTGIKQENGLVAIYTGAIPTQDPAYPIQKQCAAFSSDGYNWQKEHTGPVIENVKEKDFRDPKVIFYNPTKQWIMVVSIGTEVRFYGSENLLQWTYLSAFGKGYGNHQGIWECPELFKLTVKNENASKWVLVVHAGQGLSPEYSGAQYFIGTFDGKQFIPDSVNGKEGKWVDLGFDFYAAQSWSNNFDRTIWIAWASHTAYAQDLPTDNWRGLLSLPREISLLNLNNDYYLIQKVPKEIDELRYREITPTISLGNDIMNYYFAISDTRAIELDIELDRKSITIVNFTFKKNNSVTLILNSFENTLSIDRSACGMDKYSNIWEYKKHVEFPEHFQVNGRIPLRIFWDSCILEIFAADGLISSTNLIFCPELLEQIIVKIEGHNLKEDVNAYHLTKTMNFN